MTPLVAWLHVIALVGALVVFALGAANVQPSVRPNLVALGLALLTVAFILAGAPPLRP
jgi:hypothetical protein